MSRKVTRRSFIAHALTAGAGLAMWPLVSSCSSSLPGGSFKKHIVVLGIDGMDPRLLMKFMQEGVMPNFQHLMAAGGFVEIGTSTPPQSPVAWSDFAVGASAGVHGIFDFIHRDPATMTPYLSTSATTPPKSSIKLGGWEIPLGSGSVRELREGKPFWDYLAESEIPATIFKVPGNFPTTNNKIRSVSGMGTPDLLGSYGTFSLFTSNPGANSAKITGGTVIPVKIVDHKVTGDIIGPANSFRVEKQPAKIPFTVWRDSQNDVVKLSIQKNDLILTRGEWTDWLRLSFEMVPQFQSVIGICKILVKQVHPHFEMYVSPINIDPVDQALPVTTPFDYGRELAQAIGTFGTKGLPADTKALSYGVLSEDEYLQLSRQIYEESRRIMVYELDRLASQSGGVLFFYYSNLDQDSHMYWRALDSLHPLYSQDLGRRYCHAILKIYADMDAALGDVMARFDIQDPRFRLIVMSDHGFGPFYRSVNLNSWLLEKGYVRLIDPSKMQDSEFLENVHWSKSKAYGLGINALYINLKGREREGTVPATEARAFMQRLKNELLEMKDPLTGEQAVSDVWIGKELYGRADDKTPDLVIGWNKGYRASWETVLGSFTKEVIANNDDKWSGDHCIDPRWVPGILLSNHRISLKNPILRDVTATILAESGIPTPSQMTGKPLYEI